jgi:predicted transcriptional regulator
MEVTDTPIGMLGLTDAIDRVCTGILNGKMMREVATEMGVTPSALTMWVGRNRERSTRVREARAQAATMYDEMAQEAIVNAKDAFQLAQAKELAQHLRWKASKINPKEYGDKIEHSGSVDVRSATTEQLGNELTKLGLGAVAQALLPADSTKAVH